MNIPRRAPLLLADAALSPRLRGENTLPRQGMALAAVRDGERPFSPGRRGFLSRRIWRGTGSTGSTGNPGKHRQPLCLQGKGSVGNVRGT